MFYHTKSISIFEKNIFIMFIYLHITDFSILQKLSLETLCYY